MASRAAVLVQQGDGGFGLGVFGLGWSRCCWRCSCRHTGFGFRLGRVNTNLLANQAVLLRQIAMGIARKVRRERSHFRLRCAVFHAQLVVRIRLLNPTELLTWPHGVLGRHAVAVRHAVLHVGNVLV